MRSFGPGQSEPSSRGFWQRCLLSSKIHRKIAARNFWYTLTRPDIKVVFLHKCDESKNHIEKVEFCDVSCGAIACEGNNSLNNKLIVCVKILRRKPGGLDVSNTLTKGIPPSRGFPLLSHFDEAIVA